MRQALEFARNYRLGATLRHFGVRFLCRELADMPAPKNGAEYQLSGFVQTQSLFVHIPKTAGVSVCRTLYGSLAGGHATLRQYEDVVRPQVLDDMFVFTFVRNPFDRLLSAYRFLRNGGMNANDARFSRKHLSRYPTFEHLVHDGLSDRAVTEYLHFLPQVDFLESSDGKMSSVDYIGRFETIADDYANIAGVIGKSRRLPHLNKGRKRHADYRAAFTPAMVDRVSGFYGRSLDRLGYDFNGPVASFRLPKRLPVAMH